MGLRLLNKHHCNSENVSTVCFMSASAKNTYTYTYSITLNLNTMGETLQLNIK